MNEPCALIEGYGKAITEQYEYCSALNSFYQVYRHRTTGQFEVFDWQGRYQYMLMHAVSLWCYPCPVSGHGWM